MKTLAFGYFFGALLCVSCSHSTVTRTAASTPNAAPERFQKEATEDAVLYDSFTPVVQAQSPAGLPVPRLAESKETVKPAAEDADSSTLTAQDAFHEALEKKSFDAAMKAARSWLMSCGSPGIDECRNRAFAAMEKIDSLAGKSKKGPTKSVALWREASRCVKSAEKSTVRKPAPSCWKQARQVFQSERDALMIARMSLLDGKWAAQNSARHKEAHRAWSIAERACLLPQCRRVREDALQSSANLSLQDKEWKKAAQSTFQLLSLTTSDVPASRRKLARTEQVEKLCARIDAGAGEGACRQYETQFSSEPTFYDFSKEVTSGELSQKDILKVNAHFLPLLEACLREQALRLSGNKEEQYSLRWVIGPDGRVQTFELLSHKGTARELESCLVNQFSWWRYPRYEGENQGIEQIFKVRASASGKNP